MTRTRLHGRSITPRRLLGGATLLAILALAAPAALAEPVQQFSIQLKDLTADGRYTVVYTSNAFDSSGEAPPALEEASLRLAKGMTIRPEFRKPDRLCDTAKLAGYLFQNPAKGGTYAQTLDGFPGNAPRIEKKVSKTARATVATCRKAFLGRGTTTVDGRPRYPAPIPAKFSLFLTKPTAKGALAGIGVLSHYDKTSPIAVNELRYTVLQPIFTLNVFNDPSADGLYGYRVKLLTERTSGFRFSVAELRVESKGLVGPGSKGAKTFWATPPACPASGQVPFKAEFKYVGGQAQSLAIKVPCPRFRR